MIYLTFIRGEIKSAGSIKISIDIDSRIDSRIGIDKVSMFQCDTGIDSGIDGIFANPGLNNADTVATSAA